MSTASAGFRIPLEQRLRGLGSGTGLASADVGICECQAHG